MSEPASRPLDLEAWSRRAHFEFFRDYDQPFFNLCADVDVSGVVAAARDPRAPSFFVTTLFHSLAAANEVEEFRYRIREKGVVVYETIDAGSTVLREDGTFGFAYFDWDPDPAAFAAAASPVLDRARRQTGPLDPRDDRDDLIHYTVIPWISFTGFQHARRRDPSDSTPKIAFGRYHGPAGDVQMPVSVEVHHALMDALHVARFLEAFQRRLAASAPSP